MTMLVHKLLDIANTLEHSAHTLRAHRQLECARQVQLAADLLRRDIDVLIQKYEKEKEERV